MIRWHRSGLDALWRSASVQTHVDRVADQIAAEVRAAAPARSGAFVESIAVRRDRGGAALVTTDDFAWHLIEYGSVNNPAYAPFRAGVEAAGARFVDPGPGG